MAIRKQPVVLAILDGWGIDKAGPGNAIELAKTPTMNRLLSSYPHASLRCSGEDVGLPTGQMGNSEVGHINLGAGFIVYQWISRIDQSITDGSFFENPALLAAIDHAHQHNSTMHLMGLVSDGGVHSHLRHLEALLDLVQQRGAPRTLVHAFTDGRDTSPTSGTTSLDRLEDAVAKVPNACIASVTGRYYAMDRDNRWERIEQAFRTVAQGEGPTASNAVLAATESYAQGITDEFITPTTIPAADGSRHRIAPDDAVVFFNFRSDRARELSEALVLPEFTGFARDGYEPPTSFTTLTPYDVSLPATIAFPPQDVTHPLARVISDAGMTQFHSAETEKYPHVTFFLNGGREVPFPGEDRKLIPSPRIATYDQQPEMSAPAVCDAVIAAIESGTYDFLIVNLANCDMVGHTGSIPATVEAVQTVDTCIERIETALTAAGGVGIITADHGNAETMIDPATGGPMTAHTTNPVPVVLVAPAAHPLRHARLRDEGILSAVAPTVLDVLGLPIHADMTQRSLIQREP